MEKVIFDHSQTNIMDSLNVTRDRMDEIVSEAHKIMVADFTDGTDTENLEQMLLQCKTTNEVIATTVVWYSMAGQMQTRDAFKNYMKEAESTAFADRIMMKPKKL